ncbi:DNA transfer protein p32 [Burkholderia gladioli]|uniref:DNA transfer protein p32 n=1 Tax=Burkholderia gladioli TaxID=28095 RepID=UPI00163DE7C9|nr:DNA transfer protein p32 [Burkholderia gladioli]
MVAAAIGVGAATGLAGAAVSSSASKSAADTQADAANRAADLQNQQWQQTQANLKPYLQLGTSAISPLLAAMGYNVTQNGDGTYSFNGTNPSNILQQQFTAPTEAQAQATPGYQFTLNQGLKSVQNSAAARGLGTSGAALKGASTYATGLADSTYNDVFNRALQTFNTNYSSAANNVNRLAGLVGNGQNAASTNGTLGAAAAGNIGNTLTSGANAIASGTVGSANALTNALGGIGSNALTYGLLTNNAGGGTSGGAIGIPGWTPPGS